MIVWPFIVLTLGLTFGLGYVISRMEKQQIINNWSQNRCNPAVMMTASYFKPKSDPRTSSKFASDNFEFCMDQLVKDVMSVVLEPIMDIFSKHGALASSLSDIMNVLRSVITTLYNDFMSYISGFLQKYDIIAQQLRTTTLHLKMAFQRVHTILLSTVFMGLSIIKGIQNSVDFVIKVVLIVLGIMVALIIILFFILFPFMPLLFSVIGVITAFAVGSVAAEASSYRSGLCFDANTPIRTKNGICKIGAIKLGEKLIDGGIVTTIIKVSGKNVPLYNINNIIVSGSHLVEKSDKSGWHSVKDDKRAKMIEYEADILYCLNTTSHTIPVQYDINNTDKDNTDNTYNTNSILYFKDWEEISEEDNRTQYLWNFRVLECLNRGEKYTEWGKSLSTENEVPNMSPLTRILTPSGGVNLCSLSVGENVYDENNNPTKIIGIIQCLNHRIPRRYNWSVNMIYKENNIWKRCVENEYDEYDEGINIIGMNLITEQGTFMVLNDEKNVVAFRDFTEVGYSEIERFNSFVEDRLSGLDKGLC